jgi:hypothetical protein
MSQCAYYFRRRQYVNTITRYCYKCQAALNKPQWHNVCFRQRPRHVTWRRVTQRRRCAWDKSNHSQPSHHSASRARSCCVISLIRQLQDKPRPLVYCRRHLINLTNTWLNVSPVTSHFLNPLSVSLKPKTHRLSCNLLPRNNVAN